ncbi:MAG: thymidine kinase [Clostridiales bacterium]|nr:thymidine kinase [Clostridiales bacterium]
MAKLYFRYGAMGSSKTANAIMVQYNYHERGQNALMLKPRLDNRDGEKIVGSRSGLSAPCSYVEEMDDMDLSLYDCIIVDEAQFLKKEQVQKLVDVVDTLNIPVICYGLRADFQGNLFEGSHWLMAWADTIEEIKTVCWCGRKATCNARVAGGKVVKAGEQIVLGGNESYVALCRKHWATGELAPLEIRKISAGKKAYLPLLLEADPSEEMIDRYLEGGEMYVLMVNGQTVSVAVVLQKDSAVCELCNIVTDKNHRCKGYARKLIMHLMKLYQPRCARMEVGTDFSMVPFYEKFGFRKSYIRENFFRDNYDLSLIEEDIPACDMNMYVLDKAL